MKKYSLFFQESGDKFNLSLEDCNRLIENLFCKKEMFIESSLLWVNGDCVSGKAIVIIAFDKCGFCISLEFDFDDGENYLLVTQETFFDLWLRSYYFGEYIKKES